MLENIEITFVKKTCVLLLSGDFGVSSMSSEVPARDVDGVSELSACVEDSPSVSAAVVSVSMGTPEESSESDELSILTVD